MQSYVIEMHSFNALEICSPRFKKGHGIVKVGDLVSKDRTLFQK